MNKMKQLFVTQENIKEKLYKGAYYKISGHGVHPNVSKGANKALWGIISSDNDK